MFGIAWVSACNHDVLASSISLSIGLSPNYMPEIIKALTMRCDASTVQHHWQWQAHARVSADSDTQYGAELT
jgi:hypothetical protein